MYYRVIQQFIFTLGNLNTILGKASEQATARGYSADNFMTQRLAPDMLPFARQVQIACDAAKAAGSLLTGRAAPKFEDTEKTVAELQERIAQTLSYLNTIGANDFGHIADDTVIKVPFPAGKAMLAPDAMMQRWLPNFFFHVSMTYAILRKAALCWARWIIWARSRFLTLDILGRFCA